MDVTWIIVANQASARILQCERPSSGLHQIEVIDNPKGRLQEKELGTDRPGRAFGNATLERHALSSEENAVHRVMADFSRTLAHHLDQSFNQQKFANLILVGPPKILSIISDHLSKATRHSVVGTLNKNLAHSDEVDLAQHLDLLLRQGYRGRLYENKTAI